MRVVVMLLNDGHVNIEADTIVRDNDWIIAMNGDKIAGMFDDGEVRSIWLSAKKERGKDES